MCASCWGRGRASSTAGWIERLSAFHILSLSKHDPEKWEPVFG
jgi:hypothetical protein